MRNNNGTTPVTVSNTASEQGDLGPCLVPTARWGGTGGGSTCTGGCTTPPRLAPGASTTTCVAVMPATTAPASAQAHP